MFPLCESWGRTLYAAYCRFVTVPAVSGVKYGGAMLAPAMRLAWIALVLYPSDALAWGLQTHLFFAQYVLALLPLADPGLRAAARRLPRLVLAGACLPDLAIVGLLMGTPAFRRAHLWST